MKPIKTFSSFLLFLLLIGFWGCTTDALKQQDKILSNEKVSSAPFSDLAVNEQGAVYVTLDKDGKKITAEPLNIKDFVFADDNERGGGGSACGDVVDRDGEAGFNCCYLKDLVHYGVPYPEQIAYKRGEANYFEATSWYLRFQVFDDVTGLQEVNALFSDIWVGDECANYVNGAVLFGLNSGIGCNKRHTAVVTRLYQVNFAGPLYVCCSKSLRFSYSRNTGDDCL